MAHGVHRVMRLVAMDRPVADVLGVELVGPHRSDWDVDADLRPARLWADPAAIGAGDLEVVAVHVDRMVRHGQVAHTHADAIVFGDDERTDAWEDAAVPRPQVEVGHLHNARHIRTGFDVICVYEEGKVPIHGHKLRVFGGE